MEDHIVVASFSDPLKSQALHRSLLGSMLKKPASEALASLNASTYRKKYASALRH
jgi:hypothetical protein